MLLSLGLLCLAMNTYHEARGEPLEGQIAVAKVTITRAKKSDDPVCKVVLKRKQFSWTNKLVTYKDGKPVLDPRGYPKETKAFFKSVVVAAAVYAEAVPNPVPKSTHYHEKSIKPYWAKSYKRVAVIGNHIFYR